MPRYGALDLSPLPPQRRDYQGVDIQRIRRELSLHDRLKARHGAKSVFDQQWPQDQRGKGPLSFGAPGMSLAGFPADATEELARRRRALRPSASLPSLLPSTQAQQQGDGAGAAAAVVAAETAVAAPAVPAPAAASSAAPVDIRGAPLPDIGQPSPEKRPCTRERVWRENIDRAEKGIGPDPIKDYIMR